MTTNTDVIEAESREVSFVYTPKIVMSIEDAVEGIAQRDRFIITVLRPEIDVITIPGTDKKKVISKAGAERLLSAFALAPDMSDEAAPVLDYTGREHGGVPFIAFHRKCTLWSRTGPGEHDRIFVAAMTGYCTSWEKKYRYRKAERVCPGCGVTAIIKGKDEYGGGWLCWSKKGGCGMKFNDGDQAIEGQENGDIENPDVFDLANTILKMAEKRALVAATLVATGCSDVYTQDLDDINPVVPQPRTVEARVVASTSNAPPQATQPTASRLTSPQNQQGAAPQASSVPNTHKASSPPAQQPTRVSEDDLRRTVQTDLGSSAGAKPTAAPSGTVSNGDLCGLFDELGRDDGPAKGKRWSALKPYGWVSKQGAAKIHPHSIINILDPGQCVDLYNALAAMDPDLGLDPITYGTVEPMGTFVETTPAQEDLSFSEYDPALDGAFSS